MQGIYEILGVNSGTYVLTVSYVGTKTHSETIEVSNENLSLSIILENDPLNLQNVVVTGNFEPRLQLESSTGGTADLLQTIPGTFTDPSAGEVFTRVYSRGISASAEDDMGWYYVSLQEDGLPVSLVQHSYYSPDIFHRVDLTTEKVEAIRGGSAAITSLNGPGGIYNFISQGPRDSFGGEIQISGGVQGEGNPTYRIDGTLGGGLGKNWFYNIGGHYRNDDGARNTDFTFSKGGQLKFNLIKTHNKGYIKFYGKILDDFTNRYTGVAATNWDDPTAAFGQDFNYTALMMPAFSSNVPDGRRLDEGATNTFDPSQGVHAQDRAFGVDILQDLGQDWSLRFNLKKSRKSANWQTAISNAKVDLDNFLVSALSRDFGALFSGDLSAFGNVVFRDAQTGDDVASINNFGSLGFFQGQPNSFEYLNEGRLPNDAIMGTAAWMKQIGADEWMQKMTFRNKSERHDLSLGMAAGFSDSDLYTQGSFGYVTYELNPRMLSVTVENPGQPVYRLSDENGLSNYGGLFFDNARAKVTQLAFFANDRWEVEEDLHFDIGFQYETISHNGSKDQSEADSRPGGIDNNPLTLYDENVLRPNGAQDEFAFKYDYISFSTALNYKINDESAIFFRYSSGNKAPELNYYFNNFSGVPINRKGEIQKIDQTELGFKIGKQDFSATVTGFVSVLENVGIADFEPNEANGTIFYTPIQFNDSRTLGIEWETAYSPLTSLTFRFNGTFQNGIATSWTVYEANGSADTAYDEILDFSDNDLPFNPNLMFNLSAEYNQDKLNGFIRWQYMGEREGNVANTFQLPAYGIVNVGLGYDFNQKLSADLIDASFVVVPVLPFGSMLKMSYRF